MNCSTNFFINNHETYSIMCVLMPLSFSCALLPCFFEKALLFITNSWKRIYVCSLCCLFAHYFIIYMFRSVFNFWLHFYQASHSSRNWTKYLMKIDPTKWYMIHPSPDNKHVPNKCASRMNLCMKYCYKMHTYDQLLWFHFVTE